MPHGQPLGRVGRPPAERTSHTEWAPGRLVLVAQPLRDDESGAARATSPTATLPDPPGVAGLRAVPDQGRLRAERRVPRETRSGTVLVVDDDEYVLYTILRLLDRTRVRVLSATTAADALRRLEQEPGIAIVDLGLPDMSGYDLAVRLRDAAPDLHLLVLTGQLPDRRRLAAARVDRVFTKPFRIAQLREAVVELLEAEPAH